MTVTRISPNGLPYDGSAYNSFVGYPHTLPPTITGGGSLHDSSDSTHVTLSSDGLDGGTIVAVPLPPMTGALPGSEGTTYHGFEVRFESYLERPYLDDVFIYIVDGAGEQVGVFAFLHEFADLSAPVGTPTTASSGLWYSVFPDKLDAFLTEPLTLVIAAHAGAFDMDLLRVFEARVLIDTLTEARLRRRPLRQFPRSDGLGMSSARRQDANRSMQASLRRGGGVYF